MKLKYIEQPDEKDCGPTCLAILSKYYGKKVSISRLREYSNTDINGTNILGMINGGKKIGLKVEGFEADSIDEIKSDMLPCIVHIINDKGFEHFVIIEKIDTKSVLVMDPDGGRKKFKKNEFNHFWTNIVLLVDKYPFFNTNSESPSSKIFFKDIFLSNQSFIWSILLTSIIINFITIIGAFYFKYLIDNIIPSNIISNLHKLTLAVFILYIIFCISSFLRYQLILNMGIKINTDTLTKYYAHILNLPQKFFDTRKDGEILSRFRDADNIRSAFTSITVTLLIDILMIIIGFILLLLQNKLLFCVVMFLIPIYFIIFYSFKKPFEKYNRKEMEINSELSSKFIEGIRGINTIKNYNLEDAFFKNINLLLTDFMNKVYKLGLFTNLQLTLKDFMHLFTTLVILWVGSIQVMEGNLTLGELITFNTLVIYFFGPMERLVETQPIIQSAIVATRRILEILDLDIENQEENINPIEIKNIEFNNVSFSYGYKKNILNNINLKINRGENIAILGKSGSGKSTLSKLLLKYYVPNEGQININGVNSNKYSISNIREKIGYVAQEEFLFNGTLYDNLFLNKKDNLNKKDLINVCEITASLDFINNLPHKFNTIVENNGENFSGGQIQRIALARAILKNPDILVLDEPTSSLDKETSDKIKENLIKIKYTKIILTHDIEFAKKCDKIFIISEDGFLKQLYGL